MLLFTLKKVYFSQIQKGPLQFIKKKIIVVNTIKHILHSQLPTTLSLSLYRKTTHRQQNTCIYSGLHSIYKTITTSHMLRTILKIDSHLCKNTSQTTIRLYIINCICNIILYRYHIIYVIQISYILIYLWMC